MGTLAAGGQLAELLQDTAHFILPQNRQNMLATLKQLRLYPLFSGYRQKKAANIEKILDTLMALQKIVIAHGQDIEEFEINPLFVCEHQTIIGDCLIIKNVIKAPNS